MFLSNISRFQHDTLIESYIGLSIQLYIKYSIKISKNIFFHFHLLKPIHFFTNQTESESDVGPPKYPTKGQCLYHAPIQKHWTLWRRVVHFCHNHYPVSAHWAPPPAHGFHKPTLTPFTSNRTSHSISYYIKISSMPYFLYPTLRFFT